MADFDNRLVRGATTVADTMDAGLRAHMLRVYNYMTGALVADRRWWPMSSPTRPPLLNAFYHEVMTANGVALSPTMLGWVVMLAPLALVFFLSFRIMQMSQARRAGDLLGLCRAGRRLAGLDPDRLYRRQRGDDLLRHRRHLRRHEPVGLHHQA